MILRVVVQRCPEVPTAPKRMARTARSKGASSATRMALLPPSSSMVRPKRLDTVSATRRPTRVDPVKETKGTRESLIFFQAEDGIRDDLVTGVQTCALPI